MGLITDPMSETENFEGDHLLKEARMESLPGDGEGLPAQLLTVGSQEGAGGKLLEFWLHILQTDS